MEISTNKRGPYNAHVVDPERCKIPRTSRWRSERQNSTTFNDESIEATQLHSHDDISAETVDVEIQPNGENASSTMTAGTALPPEIESLLKGSDDIDMDVSESVGDDQCGEFESDDQTVDHADEMDDNFYNDVEDDYVKVDQGEKCGGSHDSSPLFVGSRLTVGISMLLIATFVMRHGLSGDALTDLLTLVELHCHTDNLFNSSLFLFRKYFKGAGSQQLHYYCAGCKTYSGTLYSKDSKCDKCGKQLEYFMYLPAKEQIRQLLSRPAIQSALQDTLEKRMAPANGAIDDVYAGKIYKEHFKDGFFRGSTDLQKRNEIHLSLQLNSDGVSIFNSSNCSLWPLYAVVNELPPSMRFKRDNRLFLGLWFKEKPSMNVFLEPLVEEFKDLYQNGVDTMITGGTRICRAIVLSMVADAPARCLIQNFVQFNGNYGCPCCYDQGDRERVSDKGFARIYPYKSDTPDGHSSLRTDEQTRQIAQYVQHTTSKTGHVLGVKGRSILMKLPGFSLINGTTIDYMHCILLGVVKSMISAWVSAKNRSKPWSIRKMLPEVNSRMLRITPPNFVTRLPRSFDDLKHWKASEHRVFLLYCSIPVLQGILPDPYFTHWLLLVEAVHIMLSKTISVTSLKRARILLKLYCLQIRELYPISMFTFNMHCLLHLADKVEMLGPLWCHSCFYFEDFNGEMRNLFHGTQSIELQIFMTVAIQQKLPLLTHQLIVGSTVHKLYYKMVNSRQVGSKSFCIAPNIYALGILKPITVDSELLGLLQSAIPNCVVDTCKTFKRILLGKSVIHSADYSLVTKRNSFTVRYSDTLYGQVDYFLECCCGDDKVYFAVIKALEQQKQVSSSHRNLRYVHYMKKTSSTSVVPVSEINELCFFINIDVRGNGECYVMEADCFAEST